MKLSSDFEAGKLQLRFAGELDHHAAGKAMRDIGSCIDIYLPRECVMDLSALQFMDSSGIAVILKTYKRMNEIGGRLRIEKVQKQPMRVIGASGIERILPIQTDF